MFIPFGDDNPRERTPYVNYGLLTINIGVALLLGFRSFGYFVVGGELAVDPILAEYAVDPSHVTLKTLITSMFLHDGFFHLAGNMLFLWIFGDNVEDTLGHIGYAVFYFACGLIASFAHLASVTEPIVEVSMGFTTAQIPVYSLGASGAISGIIGAYVVFFPHNRIKSLLWIFIFIQIIYLPAWIFIGIWVLLQVFQMSQGVGGVAWWAHLGGIFAGVLVAGALRAWWKVHRPIARLKKEIWESSGTERSKRKPFVPVARDDAGIEFIDAAEDKYVVVKLTDDPHGAEAIAAVVSDVTGEPVHEAARRVSATRGMISRGIPRVRAEQIQRELHTRGYATALILDAGANRPPVPQLVEAVSWNESLLRLRMGNQMMPVPWSAPFLYVAAEVEGKARLDLFVNRRTSYRLPDGIRLTKVDSVRRSEEAAVPSDLARSILAHRGSATAGEGIRMMSEGLALAFDFRQDYDDYLFWIYNLALSRAQGDLS